MENTTTQKDRRLHRVGIRRGEVIEKVASFKESAYSVVYEKAETIIRDIVKGEEKGDRSGHLLAFMGERGSGKTTAMLSFLHALKEKGDGENAFLADCRGHFTTFEVIDASMLEQDEDLFEIVLAQMLVHFLEHYKGDQLHEDVWGEGRKDARKEIHKMFNDLLEGFRSLKRQGQGEETAALVSLKNLSYSSRLKQNFQRLVKEYLACLQEPYYGQERPKQNYLVFAIDDLDMNIDKGFEMLGQLHRYMLVPQVIILVTAKYEQLETLGRKYFAYMVERLNRETDKWEIDYLNKTVKEYLEKMLPLYNRLYLPDLENNITGYADDVELEKEGKLLKQAILGKIFRRTGIFFDGAREKKHYLAPTSMRGLNDYYLFLDELAKLEAPGKGSAETKQEQALILYNCDRFLNDFIYRYMVERLDMPERLEFRHLLQKPFSEWDTHMYAFFQNIVSWLKEENANRIKGNDRILLEILLEDRKCFGNMLWGIYWCVANVWRSEEWMNCIITLYSVILNKEIAENGRLRVGTFHGSVIGTWSNHIFPPVLVNQGTRGEKMVSRFGGSNKGCRHNITFRWDVTETLEEEKIYVWFKKYKKHILSLEVMTLFIEAFHGNTRKNERVHMKFGTGKVEGGKIQTTVEIINTKIDFNILGFLTNLLDYETFYEKFHDALLSSCIAALKTDKGEESEDQETGQKEGQADLTEGEKEKLETWKDKLRGIPGLSLYRQIAEWDQEAEGLILPYQHVDIYVNLLAELQQWSQEELPVNLTEKNVWESLKATILKIEEILQNKERFLKEMDSDYDNLFSKRFAECPVVRCIKDYREMGLQEDFPEEFGRIFVNCCSWNDYTIGGYYPPEDELDTTGEFEVEKVAP